MFACLPLFVRVFVCVCMALPATGRYLGSHNSSPAATALHRHTITTAPVLKEEEEEELERAGVTGHAAIAFSHPVWQCVAAAVVSLAQSWLSGQKEQPDEPTPTPMPMQVAQLAELRVEHTEPYPSRPVLLDENDIP